MTRVDASMFSSTKLDAPNSRAVATLPHLVESSHYHYMRVPGSLAFVAPQVFGEMATVSNTDEATRTCSPAPNILLGTSLVLEAEHTARMNYSPTCS